MAQTKTAEVHGWHFHKLQIVLIIMAVLLVAGGTLIGLSQTVWQSVQNINPLPNQQINITPVTTELTPTPAPAQTSTSPATIEVKWTTNGPLESRPSAFGISDLLVQSGGIVYALEPIGPDRNRIWKSADEGQTWNETKENVFPGDLYGMTKQEKELCDKLYEMFQSQIIPSINLGVIPMGLDRVTIDPNNGENLLASVTVLEVPSSLPEMPDALKEKIQKMREIAQTQKLNTHRIFLSLDGGKSWKELNCPPGKQAPLPSISLALISSQQYVSIYVGLTDGTVWQTNLDIKSLTSR